MNSRHLSFLTGSISFVSFFYLQIYGCGDANEYPLNEKIAEKRIKERKTERDRERKGNF